MASSGLDKTRGRDSVDLKFEMCCAAQEPEP